jgi:CRP-like cAMP-binding protein
MRDLCTPALRDRLLRLLAMLARRVGEPLGDGYCRLSIRISQGELASFVRSSRQRINKLMRELVQQGDVRVRGGRIEVALRLSGSPRT